MFNSLNIGSRFTFLEHLNKHNVIHLNIQDFLSTTNSIDEMLSKINRMILKDLKFEFKDVITETEIIDAFNEVYAYTKINLSLLLMNGIVSLENSKKTKLHKKHI